MIASIISARWVPKVGKNIVKLGYDGGRAEDVWMTPKQMSQIERVFAQTPHGHSTQRAQVVGVWNERGYYAYAKLDKMDFIPPDQYDLSDLRED